MKKFIIAVLVLLIIFLSGCANQLPPGGGEEDKIPPEIVEAYPPDGTINFTEDYIEIGFSEYVDKRTVNDAIFISPFVEGNLELDWSGRYVRIKFPEKLRENTTYVITVGTDVVDFNNRNRMASAYTLTFSTGDKIDRRVITGRIFGEKPEGILMFAYKSFSDSINPSVTKPDYLSQTGNDGQFRIGGLAAGTYRIFAVDDDFRDLLFQPEQDRIGVPFMDVVLGLEDTLFTGLNYFLTSIDSVPPRILSAAMTDRNHILVAVSEIFDSTIIRADNFFIYDSTAGRRIDVKYAYKGDTKADELVLVPDQNLDLENNVFLVTDTLLDRFGNIFRNEEVSITVSDRPDTTKLQIVYTEPRAGSASADFVNQSIYFRLNDAVDSTLLKKKISFTDTLKKSIAHSIYFIDDASFRIIPATLEPSTDYIININFSGVTDAAGNKNDSLFSYTFRTISGLDFTGASGVALNSDQRRNPVLILDGVKGNTEHYKINITGQTFEFKRVRPGEYLLWGYYDEDSSGTYSYGSYLPFHHAEEFSFYPDTLNLRARWVVTDLKFNFASP